MFFLALRHLISRKRQTTLTLLGITLGAAAYIAISAMMLGFQEFIIDQLVNNDSHVRINAREEMLNEQVLNDSFFPDGELVNWVKPPMGRKDNAYILAPRAWLDRLEADEKVQAASPQLVAQAIANYAKLTVGVRLIGSIPDIQRRVSNIEKYMLKGKFSDIGASGNRIVVGKEFLDKIGASIGESILLTVGKSAPQPFKIVGVFRLGVKSLDETTVFGALSDVQKLNQTPSRISDIAIRLVDVEQASELASNLNLMGQEKVQSWNQANEGIMSVFKTQDIVRNSMTFAILIVAGFGIYNILSLAVSHKRREIAILRSMGFEPRDISELFLTQGVILGVIGGLLGVVIGLGASYGMSLVRVSEARGLGTGQMMVSFDGLIYVKAFLLACIASSVASFFSARAAGRLEPIDIIRGEN
ncbi:MAG TPA: ABC transporter permease, partial [Oligoflexia bacterium]|nr:ABC transporter permease [Oligoflexia bacterium]